MSGIQLRQRRIINRRRHHHYRETMAEIGLEPALPPKIVSSLITFGALTILKVDSCAEWGNRSLEAFITSFAYVNVFDPLG